MLKGDASSVSSITRDFQKKKKDGYCKVSDFIEIKKINLKIINLTLLVLL
jgi:hypothetical protein